MIDSLESGTERPVADWIDEIEEATNLVREIFDALGTPVRFSALVTYLQDREVPWRTARVAIALLIERDELVYDEDDRLEPKNWNQRLANA